MCRRSRRSRGFLSCPVGGGGGDADGLDWFPLLCSDSVVFGLAVGGSGLDAFVDAGSGWIRMRVCVYYFPYVPHPL